MLGADQRHGPIGALFAQRHGGRGAGQACADDHVRVAIRPRSAARRLRPVSGYTLTGSVAGGASTLPVRTSNSEPWHVQVTVVPASSPFFGKRALLVRARVVERVVRAADVGDRDPRAAHVDGRDAACRYLARLDCCHKFCCHWRTPLIDESFCSLPLSQAQTICQALGRSRP